MREIIIKDPTPAQDKKAREIYISKYNQLRLDKSSGYVPKAKIFDLMRELGEWDDEAQKTLDKLRAELRELISPLNQGGIPLVEMRARAVKAQNIRSQIGIINMSISEYENQFTYESHADDAKYHYLLWACSHYKDTDELVFPTEADYLNCADKTLLATAGNTLNKVLYGDIKELYRDIAENRFLIDYGFMDTEFKMTEDKNKEPSFKPFLDDEGNPIEKPKV